MVVIAHADHFEIFDEFAPCPGCDAEESLYDTGCEAAGHNGYGCPECGWGCDYGLVDDEDSRCVQELAEESSEQYEERVRAERSFLGLPDLGEVTGDA